MTHTADTPCRAQTHHPDSFSTGLTWKRNTSLLRPAAFAVVAIVLNFLVITAFSYDYAAGTIA